MNLKSFFFPQDRRFESLLKRYAIYSPDKASVRFAPTQRIFDLRQFKYLSLGIQARVYKHRVMDWVVKEGKWDLEFKLFKGANIPMPAALTEKVLNLFAFTFLPTVKEILRQYKAYLRFIQYFGFFKDEKDYFHPNIELINVSQKNIRDTLSMHIDEMEAHYKIKFDPKIEKVLTSEVKYHNFLPKEYLLIGKSITPSNKGRTTFFIVQRFVKGELLHDIDLLKQNGKVINQMVLLIYLILLMNYQINLVVDTRPRYPILQAYDYLTKTDNIIINKEEVKFIDTRWFWDYKSNIIKRGLIIPDLILNMSKTYINTLLNYVE